MRLNLPVSNIEFTLPDGAVIVSKTDLKGVVTYCNSTFVEVSGFSRDEIVGSPHNIVRHPDMPPAAFADMWKTIKANKPWQGVVKNRRKDGSFYWAISNITPLKAKGKTVGYVAFRYKATQEQVARASAAYQEIRAGSRKLRIEEGNVVQMINPLLHWLNAFSIRARLVALMLVLLGALIAVGVFNLYAAKDAYDRAADSLTHAGTQAYALTMARNAEAAFKEQRLAWKNILIRGRSPALLKQHLDEFDRRGEEVEHILVGLLIPVMQQIGLPTDEVDALLESHMLLSDKYRAILKRSDARNLQNIPVLDALTEGADQQVSERFTAIIATIREEQLRSLGQLNETLEASHHSQNRRSIETLAAAALVGLLMSIWLIAGILKPIRRASLDLDRVVQLQQQFLEKILVLEEYHDRINEEQRIGSYIMGHITNIHGTMDPLIRHLIRPAEHLSGDILLAARTPDDVLHILLADAVGHGLVAAVNVLPLSQAFYDMTGNGFRIAQIAEEMNQKINRLMPADRFVAATLVSVNVRNRVIEVWNGGNPAPLLIDRDGEILREWESANLPLGILPSEIFSGKPEIFHYADNCQLCLFSDGLPEAESPLAEPFGKDRIDRSLRDSAPKNRFDALMAGLDSHLAGKPAHDDISLALVEIPTYIRTEAVPAVHAPAQAIPESGGNWKIGISLGAAELKYLNIVPMLTGIIEKIHVANEFAAPLFMILSELFNNALDHGILRLDSSVKQGVDGFDKFLQLREERLHTLDSGRIDLEIEKVVIEGKYGVKIRVADSGKGFDYAAFLADAENQVKRGQHGRGIALVGSLAYKLEYAGNGNEVTACYVCV